MKKEKVKREEPEMISEALCERVTQELERVGYADYQGLFNDNDRWVDFCLQIEAMIQYGVEITGELVERIISVIEVTIYREPESLYIL